MRESLEFIPGGGRPFFPSVQAIHVQAGGVLEEPLPDDVKQSHLGIGICLVGYCCSALGLLIQKMAHLRQAEIDDVEWCTNGKVPEKDLAHSFFPSSREARLIFLGGFSLMCLGDSLALMAMGLAAQSVLGPLGCTSMIVNTLLAPILLGETVLWRHWIAVFVLCIGCVVVVTLGPEAEDVGTISVTHLKKLAQQLEFIVVAASYVAAASFSAFILWHQNATADTDTPATTSKRYLRPVLFATVAGVSCSFGMLVGKCASTLLWAIYFEGTAIPWRPLIVLVSIGALLGACTFISVNVGLRHCDATDFVPAYYSVSMLAMILLGAVFFEEFDSMVSEWQILCFSLGVATVLLGVYILVRQDYQHVVGADEVDPDAEVAGEKTSLLSSESTQRKTTIFGPAPPGFAAGQHPEVALSASLPQHAISRVDEASMGLQGESASKSQPVDKLRRAQTWAAEVSEPARASPPIELRRAKSTISQVAHGRQRPHRTYSVSLFGFPGIA
eukprot:gnl/TRDRNA2_/TRDRNA2_85949_c0_seq1.p1 gnl/TRDRNA2_/TRDRNA2_85949_c0~~gnl/TRDRNA2_/TRDRNA2_85949_c0_seq1.p1  ORF type:complete len:501 (+),score=77.85 gnl/TRDRNA2_/TRDRNA2_85949_c0_seq1:87-1589(+)